MIALVTTVYPTYVLRLTPDAPDGTVSKVAGNGRSGYVDGPAENAEFRMPCGIAVAPDGSVYVADGHASGGAIYQPGNNVIRKISKGIVSTVAGTGKPGFKFHSISPASHVHGQRCSPIARQYITSQEA